MSQDTMYIPSRVLTSDGDVKDTLMDTSQFSFDFTKYIDEQGNLYFLEQSVNGELKNVIVKKDAFLRKCAEYGIYIRKHKMLGVGHFFLSYIWLPLVIIVYFVACIVSAIACIVDRFIIWGPELGCSVLVFASALYLLVSLWGKNRDVMPLLHSYFPIHIMAYTADTIENIMESHSFVYNIPIASIAMLIMYLCYYSYYKKRIDHFASNRKGKLFRYATEYIQGLISFNFIVSSVLVEAYSLYYMFKMSVGYFLFGLFVPVIGQIYFLFDTGFTTVYAYLVYYCILSFLMAFIVFGMIEVPNETG